MYTIYFERFDEFNFPSSKLLFKLKKERNWSQVKIEIFFFKELDKSLSRPIEESIAQIV